MVCQAFGTIGSNRYSREIVQTLITALNAPDKNLNIAAVQALDGI